MLLVQKTQLLTVKERDLEMKINQKPLTAFVMAETALASRLIKTIHQSLSIINRSLKSNSSMQLSLMEAVVDIANLKV